MLGTDTITTLAAVEWQHALSLLSLVVGVLALAVTLLKHLDTRAAREREGREIERQQRADERHETLCGNVERVHDRVTETKRAVEALRGETATEFAALHRRDAELALDLERRVAPIEGKLGMGRARAQTEGGD